MGKGIGKKYYEWDESKLRRDKQAFIAIIVFIALVLFALASCKVSAPVMMGGTQARRDSTRIEYKHDSIYTDRWHKIYIKGDTVFIHDSIYVDRWHRLHDTLRFESRDTIYQPVPYEKKGSAFLRNSGIALWVIIGLIILAVIAGIVIKVAK